MKHTEDIVHLVGFIGKNV